MKSLYAPSPLNDQLRPHNWKQKTTVNENSFKTWIPQAHDIAKRAISQLCRQKTLYGLGYFGNAHLQIVENEITDAMKLHMSGLTTPPKHKYVITIKKQGDFITAYVESQEV